MTLKVFRVLPLVVLTFGLVSCAPPVPPPPKYDLIGSQDLLLRDTVYSVSSNHATFCVALEIDGKSVDNAIESSVRASRGQGNRLSIRAAEREIDPGLHRVKIGCREVSPMPIFDMLNGFQVSGTVDLQVEPHHSYTVRGRFEGKASSTWIDDDNTAAPATKILTGGA